MYTHNAFCLALFAQNEFSHDFVFYCTVEIVKEGMGNSYEYPGPILTRLFVEQLRSEERNANKKGKLRNTDRFSIFRSELIGRVRNRHCIKIYHSDTNTKNIWILTDSKCSIQQILFYPRCNWNKILKQLFELSQKIHFQCIASRVGIQGHGTADTLPKDVTRHRTR